MVVGKFSLHSDQGERGKKEARQEVELCTGFTQHITGLVHNRLMALIPVKLEGTEVRRAGNQQV